MMPTGLPDGRVVLCTVESLADRAARGFVVGSGSTRRDIVVVRVDGVISAYRNACPHQGVPLETFPDRFLDASGRHLVCSVHGARFRVADGYCVSGPCRGQSLVCEPIEVKDGLVLLGA